MNWEIYAPYAGAARMLLHINAKFTMGKLKSSFFSFFLYNFGITESIDINNNLIITENQEDYRVIVNVI